MSGGSYNYAYSRIEDLADEVERNANTPLHKAFAQHLRLVAKAAHDLEWVDSGDYGPGDEIESIRAVVSPAFVIETAKEELQKAIDQAQELLEVNGTKHRDI